jgi:hypothetical protein
MPVDKSVLAVAAPRRYRNREHLRAIVKQPCLVCGRKPSDPHHLRYAQPKALGRKASDEFTVPLCRTTIAKFTASGARKPGGKRRELISSTSCANFWRETRHRGSRARANATPNLR